MLRYRMTAMLKWLGKLLLGAALMTSISLLTTWYMVNAFMDKALEKINLTALDENLKFSDVWGKVSEDLNIVLSGEGKEEEKSSLENRSKDANIGEEEGRIPAGKDTENDSVHSAGEIDMDGSARQGSGADDPADHPRSRSGPESGTDGQEREASRTDRDPLGTTGDPGPSSDTSTTDSDASEATESPFEQEAVEVWSRSEAGTEAMAESGSQGGLAMSMDDFNQKKEKISNADKMEIFTMLSAKLRKNEMMEISRLLEDGLTKEELELASEIVKQRLTEEEFQKLATILEKYE